MVLHVTQAELEARLRAAGEQVSFETRSLGHLQHRCVNFPNTVVNFWPSTGSANVQGKATNNVVALELILKKPVATNNMIADKTCPQQPPNRGRPACTASGAPHSGLSSKAGSMQCGDTSGESAAAASVNAPQAKVPSRIEDKSYIPRLGDEPVFATVGKELVVSNCPDAVERRPPHAAVRAAAPEEPLCSEVVKLVKATVIEDVEKQIAQSFSWWRGEQRRTMREMYMQFCNERKHACQSAFSSPSDNQNPFLPERLQTMMSEWLAREGCVLEKTYPQWEDREHAALGLIFTTWMQRFDGIIAQVLTRVKADLRLEAQRELETWKMQERKHLLADMGRVSAVNADERQSLRHELVSVRQQHRAEAAKRETAECRLEDLQRRAESAEVEARRAAAVSAASAQKRPVFSERYERLSKRLCLDAPSHPILGKFEGDLFRKIKSARSAGLITAHQEGDMHQMRKAGNDAAHSAIGTFGTQVPRNEAHPDTKVHEYSGGDCDVDDCDVDGYDCDFDRYDGYH